MKKLLVLSLLFLACASHSTAERIKVGVPLALTGDLAAAGEDARDGILFANEQLGQDRYELIIEDAKCDGKGAVEAAHKLLTVDKVSFIVGLSCNTELLSSAKLFERAKVPVIAVSATSGDLATVGEYIFRPFPADHLGAKLLYQHMKTRFKRVAILTEDEEYATLLERAFRYESDRDGVLSVVYEQFPRGSKDFRTLLLRILSKKPEAIFLNPSGEAGFIPLIKQARVLKINIPLFAEYMPGSRVVLEEARSEVEGMVFADLPSASDVGTGKGAEILKAMEARFGAPRSISLIRSLGYTSFQMLDQAVRSGGDVQKFLKNRSFSSELLGNVSFTPENTLQGLAFTLKQIKNGAPVAFDSM